ncbi:NAD(P)H-binding protein [Providencia stuartii]|uniref:NAD(P)H-binding protein n=1 Tax=Providencia stuartii TaxID=588 RepID=A0AAI9HWG9_PROST|nr:MULTISPECIES: NAD(P)H-binding protein [Providencia]ELR5033991.1 NAD(P)H-binding protein [Providencia stuartii]ELR5141387.1 NAD(P)H-binding protein [Providencia stuartii]WBA58721.1 NAD(P)H-binding protein [Providencia sp. 21OH12SH02B-Prov]WER23881.1 NAD(P)H-binding protein [Providencia stuartii]WER28001.1 NAD(P)H-binding protein [Providencia stuartii]
MAHWVIFGATKGIGLLLAKWGVAQGHRISVLVRHQVDAETLAAAGMQAFIGDATDIASLESLFADTTTDSIIFTTIGGGQADFYGNYNIIRKAEQSQISRLLLVTSIGCGDSWSTLSPRAKSLFGQSVRQKTMAESYLQTSEINYTILRPGGLMNTAATYNAKLVKGEAHGVVSREDVAMLLANLVDDKHSYQQVYAVIDPDLQPNWR